MVFSSKIRSRPMWYRRSPPVSKSITKYRLSLSWNECTMFTRNLSVKRGYSSWICARMIFSFITEFTDFLWMILG